MKHTMKVKIRDTEHLLYEGDVDRVSSFNEVGRFDVYPMHANFISIIQKQLTCYLDNKKIKEFPVEQAIMKVKKDIIKIFLGVEVLVMEEIENTQMTTPTSSQK